MTAPILPVSADAPDPAILDRAAAALRAGSLVVLPTETVYGWACRGDDADAVAALRAAKGRDGDKPFTLHLAARDEPASVTVARAVGPLLPPARRLADRTLPGPLTMVVRDRMGDWIGVRVPDHRVAAGVLARCPFPVLATSVNRSGEPPAGNAAEAAAVAGPSSALILDAGPAAHGIASTVVRCTPPVPEVLREGATPGDHVPVLCARWLVFVDGGGTLRAPLAEAVARTLLRQGTGLPPSAPLAEAGVHTIAAGLSVPVGARPSPLAAELAGLLGSLAGCAGVTVDRTRPCEAITPTLVEAAERVWVMTAAQRASILATMPQAEDRVTLLDPRGGDLELRPGGPAAERNLAMAVHRAVADRVREHRGTEDR